MVDSAQKYSADVHRRKSLCTLNKKQALSIGSCAIVFIILCVVLLLLLLNGRSEQEANEFKWPSPSKSIEGVYKHAAVAADNGICSEIGRNILLKGGNAVDSAVATTICIGVFDAHSSGIGGGHFSVIYLRKQRRCVAIDAREMAPSASYKDMFVNDSKSSIFGGKSIAVPGELHGLWVAYKKYGGKLPWRDLLMPTAEICRTGILVSQALAEKLQMNEPYIVAADSQLRIFINPKTGRLYQAGEVMYRPELAQLLQDLAEATDPVQLFYNSSKTKEMVEEMKEYGGIITEEDMRSYVSKAIPPVEVPISDGIMACGPPPPSSAAIAMAILSIMSGYNLTAAKDMANAEAEALTYHRFIEAMKFSYAAHSKLGDPNFKPEIFSTVERVLSKDFSEEVRRKINAKAHPTDFYGEAFAPKSTHGTAHLGVLDSEGNAVALTSTINLYFGSKMRSLKYDVIWNDGMDDFSTPGLKNYFEYPPLLNNFIMPGKRPLSSMTPMVIYDKVSGDVRLVVGAAGGSRIITTTAYITMRSLWLNETIKQAMDAPRLHNQLIPEHSYYEELFPQGFVKSLEKRAQNMRSIGIVTAATGIQVTKSGEILANSDWRKPGGYPAGY
ncbi:hypothetical protein M514_07140 [Trichuris suis]|uniref:Gamma-glutamyltransferase n=1 Tax=Trichuris suis TaxID=68888 RepID=A0A085NPI1_9BILA|nr:hypothetical protein M514_07140 [Trichuris suis]